MTVAWPGRSEIHVDFHATFMRRIVKLGAVNTHPGGGALA